MSTPTFIIVKTTYLLTKCVIKQYRLPCGQIQSAHAGSTRSEFRPEVSHMQSERRCSFNNGHSRMNCKICISVACVYFPAFVTTSMVVLLYSLEDKSNGTFIQV